MEKTGSVYKLVILAARRAIELNSGAGKLVEASPNSKPSMLALEEIRQGRVRLKAPNEHMTSGPKRRKS